MISDERINEIEEYLFQDAPYGYAPLWEFIDELFAERKQLIKVAEAAKEVLRYVAVKNALPPAVVTMDLHNALKILGSQESADD